MWAWNNCILKSWNSCSTWTAAYIGISLSPPSSTPCCSFTVSGWCLAGGARGACSSSPFIPWKMHPPQQTLSTHTHTHTHLYQTPTMTLWCVSSPHYALKHPQDKKNVFFRNLGFAFHGSESHGVADDKIKCIYLYKHLARLFVSLCAGIKTTDSWSLCWQPETDPRFLNTFNSHPAVHCCLYFFSAEAQWLHNIFHWQSHVRVILCRVKK